MAKLKDTPKKDRPREKFLEKGADALTKSELLVILLGSGIKGKNVKVLAEQIIDRFEGNFLKADIKDLQKIAGIGQAKALQISAAFSLVDRILKEETPKLKRKIKKNLQKTLFDSLESEIKNQLNAKKNKETYFHIQQAKENHFQLHNRRYIGNKQKLIEWIFSILDKKCKGNSFTDIFAGTGIKKLQFNQITI